MSINTFTATLVLLLAAVLVLAWSRKRSPHRSDHADESLTAPTDTPANDLTPAQNCVRPTEFVLGPKEAPYVRISRALRQPAYRTETFAMSAGVQREVYSWLQHLPRLAMSGSLFATNRYVVTFSSEVTRALSNGSMELMRSGQEGYYAIAVTADGKRIVQSGMIQKAGFPVAVIPTLLWQVAAIATAQRFLADINKQLAKIGNAVEFIKRYLEAERVGRVQASFDRLTEIATALNSRTWALDDAQRWVGMLDDLDLECSTVVHAGLAQKQEFLQKSVGVDIGTFLLKKKAVEQAVQNSQEFASHFGLCTSALYVRVATTHVRAALPVGRAGLGPRLASCAQDSRALREVNDQHFVVGSRPLLDMLSNEKAIFSRETRKQVARKRLADSSTATRNRIKADLDEIDRIIEGTEKNRFSVDKAFDTGLTLELEIGQGGTVQSASRIV